MKKILNFLIIIILLWIVTQIFLLSNEVMDTVIFSFDIWKNNVFPSLFPFFILSEFLIQFGFVEWISKFFSPIMNKFFKTSGKTAFIFIMSLLSGFPSNAKYTYELYQNQDIDDLEATKILMFTHFSNPLFIMGTVSLFLGSKKAGIIVLFSHYISNVIIGLLFRNSICINQNRDINFEEQYKNRLQNRKRFGVLLKDAVMNTINTLLMILGTVTVFLILTTIINHNINLNSDTQSFINGIFEMTQGLKYISMTNMSIMRKSILSAMILSFGGFSVHMQVLSIIGDTKIKYQPYLIARLLHSAIAGILVFFIFQFIIF